MSDEETTGILGNTQDKQKTATTDRQESKTGSKKLAFRIGIGVTLLLIIIILAEYDLNFFWKMVTAVALLKTSRSMRKNTDSDLVWIWPRILQILGWILLLGALINSGIGQWTQSLTSDLDTWTSCKADSTQKKCVEEEQKEKLTAYSTPRVMPTYILKPTKPTDSPSKVTVPSCDNNGWVKVNIPARWSITLAWNKSAATYEWRSVETGQWEEEYPQGGSDAVRFCAKHKAYAGDEMILTWKAL